MSATVEECLEGRALHGDDFNLPEIESWYRDEETGYFDLNSSQRTYAYGYHELNRQLGFSRLPTDRQFHHALAFGSAWGHELQPMLHRIEQVTLLDVAAGFEQGTLGGKPVRFARPSIDGSLPFADRSFDLITCLGVLHHIPNVSTVVAELYRCCEQDGYALVREPIVSMGDWRVARQGLTRRERGIPRALFRLAVQRAGFQVISAHYCVFSLVRRVAAALRLDPYNTRAAVTLDRMISALPVWRYTYHARSWLQKLQPNALYFVLRRAQ